MTTGPGKPMDHSYYLKLALEEARKARDTGQNPIGCVIVDGNGQLLARAHNEVEKRNDKTAHAEMLAIAQAAPPADDESVREWTLYTTMEPCFMCMGTIIMTHIGTVVWGTNDVLQQTHTVMDKHPFLRTRRLVTVPCPDAGLEEQCRFIYEEFWTEQGRPEILRPIIEEPEAV